MSNPKSSIKLAAPYTECKKCPVRNKSLFKNVPDNRLQWIQRYRRNQIKIPARSVIFQEGDTHDFIYTLYSGWSILYKTVSNTGKRQILRFLLPGDLLGYQTNASGVIAHSAGTVTESVLCAFPRAELKAMLRDNQELALQLVNMESRDMSLCQNHLMATGRKTARESIAFVLLELYYRVQSQIGESFDSASKRIDFPVTQEDLGDAVGLTNVHVNRVIKELMDKKLIQCHKKQLRILNEKKLCEIAEFNADMITASSII